VERKFTPPKHLLCVETVNIDTLVRNQPLRWINTGSIFLSCLEQRSCYGLSWWM